MTIEEILALITLEAEQYSIDPSSLKDLSLKLEIENPEIGEGVIDDIDTNITFNADECVIKLIITLY